MIHVWMIILFLILFMLVHIAKMTRLYLVLLEQKISFGRFVVVYLKTTCVNLIVPFKLGEIYRVYALAKETKKFPVGFLSVLVDRFFDTVSLLLILIPVFLLHLSEPEFVPVVLAVILIFLAMFYMIFPSTNAYLNALIIKYKTSRRSMAALSTLDRAEDLYEYCKQLIRGRSILMIAFSCMGWILEGLALMVLSKMIGEVFGFGEFSQYIASIFTTGGSRLLHVYTIIGIVVLVILTILVCLIRIIGRKEVKNQVE